MRLAPRLALATACAVTAACATTDDIVQVQPPRPDSQWFESVFPRVLRPSHRPAATRQAITAALPGSTLTVEPTGHQPPLAFARRLVPASTSGPCARYELLDECPDGRGAELDDPRTLRSTLAVFAEPLDFAAAQALHGLRVRETGSRQYVTGDRSQVFVPGVMWSGLTVYYLIEQQKLAGLLALDASYVHTWLRSASRTGRRVYPCHTLDWTDLSSKRELLPVLRDLPAECRHVTLAQVEAAIAREEKTIALREGRPAAAAAALPDLADLRAQLETSEREYEAARARGDRLVALQAAMDGARLAQDVEKKRNPVDHDRYFSEPVTLWVCRTYESRWALLSEAARPADAPGRYALYQQLEDAVNDGQRYRLQFTISKPAVARVLQTLRRFESRMRSVRDDVIRDQHAARRAEEERREAEAATRAGGGTSGGGGVGSELSAILRSCQATADFHARQQALNDGKLPSHLR